MKPGKPELLSPAGSWEHMVAAVSAGCDSIYLGGKQFSARKNAGNFTLDELAGAIDYCHLRGVKIYIALNTLYADSELQAVLDFAAQMYHLGADAFIVQDIGLAGLILKHMPSVPIHASTQMTAHSLGDVFFLQKKGFQRVVLARELLIEEMAAITAQCDCEIEVFVHGALCVCYSGQCLASSLLGGRSGNRGSCAQPCRLPYTLLEDGNPVTSGYLLSPKDMAAFTQLPALSIANTTCLKIEGRMKNVEYVTAVTVFYRDLIDRLPECKPNEELLTGITQVFNRGGAFTEGYGKKYAGFSMISIETPKSVGRVIGNVSGYNSKNKAVEISAREKLIPGDGLEIRNKGESLGGYVEQEVLPGAVYYLKTGKPVPTGTEVRRSFDKALQKKLSAMALKEKKLELAGSVYISGNGNLSFRVKKDGISVCKEDNCIQQAQTKPMSEADIAERFTRSGNTAFTIKMDECSLRPDIFIPVSKINGLRRGTLDEFADKWVSQYRRQLSRFKMESLPVEKAQEEENLGLSVSVNSEAAFYSALQKGVRRIYLELAAALQCELEILTSAATQKGIRLFVALPRITREDKLLKERIAFLEGKSIAGYLVRTWGQLHYLSQTSKEVICDYSLHVFNQHSAKFIGAHGKEVTLSPELKLEQILALQKAYPFTETIVYGYMSLMVTAQCPVGLYKEEKENRFCALKGQRKGCFMLEDRKGARFPVVTDCDSCTGYIYNSVPLQMLGKAKDIIKLSGHIRLSFTVENEMEIATTTKAYLNMLAGEHVEMPQNIGTYGHFYRGVL